MPLFYSFIMAKDPAILFYFQDFLVGTAFMTDEEVGKYMRILCYQADKKFLTMEQLTKICKGDVPEIIMEKLCSDGNGKYYQKRMLEEQDKRKSYSESRRQNRMNKKDMNIISISYVSHMENENENENINKKENKNMDKKESLREQKLRLLNQRREVFKQRVRDFAGEYPPEMLEKFFLYWSEMNKSGSQMRWEMERTWELARRLATWASREKGIQRISAEISYKELVRRYNDGETDIWERYEQAIPGDKRSTWRLKK